VTHIFFAKEMDTMERQMRVLNNTHSSHLAHSWDTIRAAIMIQKRWRGYVARKKFQRTERPLRKKLIQEYKPTQDITRIMARIQQKSLECKDVIVSKEKLERNTQRAKELLDKQLLDWVPRKEINYAERIEHWMSAIEHQEVATMSDLDDLATPEILQIHKRELKKASGGWWRQFPDLLDENSDDWLPDLERGLNETERCY
jgi:hypothetical protein